MNETRALPVIAIDTNRAPGICSISFITLQGRSMRRSSLEQLHPRRICIIKPSAFGDVVQALSLLSALRQRWPDAHVAWVIRAGLADLLENHPQIDEVIEFQRQGSFWSKSIAFLCLLRQLRRGQYDLTLDLQGLARSGIMTWCTRAEHRVGFRGAREGAGFAYTDQVEVDWQNNRGVNCYWRIAQALGCAGTPPAIQLGLTPEHLEWAHSRIAGLPRPLLMIHPGAQWETKRWPPESFAVLARAAQEEMGASIVLIGGQREGVLCEAIEKRLTGTNVVNLAEQARLLQLAALLKQGDVFLSGDTGPMHLAAALGTRCVSVFTCTSPRRSGPFGDGHQCVATGVPCAASYRKKCPTQICKSELTPDRVWPALRHALHTVLSKCA